MKKYKQYRVDKTKAKDLTFKQRKELELRTNKLLPFLTNDYTSRELLRAKANYNDDRAVRFEINNLRHYICIISSSDKTGYKLAPNIDDIKTIDEMDAAESEVNHFLRETQSRIEELRALERAPIAYLMALGKHRKKFYDEKVKEAKNNEFTK